ncbi:hypothetical protein [Micromonospora sp. DH14]|uniref:hypothetical protein n=1 Tax=Micromonospora sp. DH14 TaxID=3040120 RepID=UPI002443296A|nr:hypothetical protein [Micromonospora sp. DH14]MDG9678447.1 hypothetical protein [Micromonospora sp. DH14]
MARTRELDRQRHATPLIAMRRSGNDAREVIREVSVGAVDEIAGDGRRLACLIVGATVERIRDDQRVPQTSPPFR